VSQRLFTIEVRPKPTVRCLDCWGQGYIVAAATCMAYDCETCNGKGWR
jgi:DnaJ-class molecular chaperone